MKIWIDVNSTRWLLRILKQKGTAKKMGYVERILFPHILFIILRFLVKIKSMNTNEANTRMPIDHINASQFMYGTQEDKHFVSVSAMGSRLTRSPHSKVSDLDHHIGLAMTRSDLFTSYVGWRWVSPPIQLSKHPPQITSNIWVWTTLDTT